MRERQLAFLRSATLSMLRRFVEDVVRRAPRVAILVRGAKAAGCTGLPTNCLRLASMRDVQAFRAAVPWEEIQGSFLASLGVSACAARPSSSAVHAAVGLADGALVGRSGVAAAALGGGRADPAEARAEVVPVVGEPEAPQQVENDGEEEEQEECRVQ